MPDNISHSTRKRKSIRLRGWDYTKTGAYFITICTHQREPIFGEVIDRRMKMNDWGSVVVAEWRQTERLRNNVTLDEFIVMPNHVHGIIWITHDANTNVGAQRAAPLPDINVTPKSLGAIVRSFKSAITRTINQMRQTPNGKIWQRNYYDRIVRDDEELNTIRHYIRQNPARWSLDQDVINEIEILSFQ